jgi:Dockerin type I domain
MTRNFFNQRTPAPTRPRHRFRPRIQVLENRLAPALLTVNSLADNLTAGNGLVTLREAIIAANTDATTDLGQTGSGADTIAFASSLFTGGAQTLTLLLGELHITSDLTVTGPGSATLTISGNDASRIFNVDAGGMSPTVAADLTGMTLTDGFTASVGGAVVTGENLSMSNMLIDGNQALWGGGIYNFGTLSFSNSTLSNNRANSSSYGGGGLYNVGTFSTMTMITDSTVSNNHASRGAGIFDDEEGMITIINSTISGNEAGIDGGGIFSRFGTVTLANSTLSANLAFSGDGGAIDNESGVVTLTECTLSDNWSFDGNGGAIKNTYIVTLTNCSLMNNYILEGGHEGGGILNGGTATLTNCTVTGGSSLSATRGGGIFNGNELILNGSTISNNLAYLGSGIFNEGPFGTATLITSTVSNNRTYTEGGGIYNDQDASMTLISSTVSGNLSDRGGGIANFGGTVIVMSTTLLGNTATVGGGIVNESDGSVALTNSTLSDNWADTNGGGFFNTDSGFVSLANCTLSDNLASAHGGAFFNNTGVTTSLNNTIVANSLGGGLIYNVGALQGSHNLVEGGSPAGLVGTITADPMLGPLMDNGGPTHTYALLSGSPAINAGDNTLLPADTLDLDGDGNRTEPIPFDQRGGGHVRVFGPAPDIGAFEVQPIAPKVQSVAINGGAIQRSRVTELTVTFSTQVTFAGAVGNAFTLTRTGGGGVNFTATASVAGGVTVVTVTGFTGAEAQFGSLKDGRYTLTALASQISAGGIALDGNGDGTPGDNYTFGDAQGLFRFYGDINGDRHVDIADFGLFSGTFNLNSGQTGFLAAVDFNNDGHIDIADFGQFSVRLFTPLP